MPPTRCTAASAPKKRRQTNRQMEKAMNTGLLQKRKQLLPKKYLFH